MIADLAAALEVLRDIVAIRLEQRDAHAPGSRLDRILGRAIHPGLAPLPPPAQLAPGGRLREIVEAYQLTSPEALILVAATALHLDRDFAELFAELAGDDRPRLSGDAAALLCGPSLAGRVAAMLALDDRASLLAEGMLEVERPAVAILPATINLTPELAHWLLGLPPYEPQWSEQFPARRLGTVHTVDDLVVPAHTEQALRELVDRIASRPVVLDEWGMRRHHDNAAGVHALFHGPPGTGKTMAAAVVGAEAGLPVYRVDLSSMLSKYIGDTEKNLAKLFDRAELRDWILFIDEADSLLGKRTDVSDARDRFANQQISYLLQRLEAHPGVTIMATNLLANIDVAFKRRLHVQIEFPEPTAGQRRALWAQMASPGLPLGADVSFDELARRFQLTGAEIRNAMFGAAYLAAADGGVVSAALIEQAIRREARKAGKSITVET